MEPLTGQRAALCGTQGHQSVAGCQPLAMARRL